MDMDRGWNEYRDSRLVVQVPAYLRQRNSMLLFEAPKKRRPGQNIIMLGANVLADPNLIEASRGAIENFRPYSVPEAGYETILIARGKPEWLGKGSYLLTGNRNLSTGQTIYSLGAVFDRSRMTLDVTIVGDGDLDLFKQVAKSMIEGIRAVDGADTGPPTKRSRRASNGLSRSDRAKLNAALKELPTELAYLRKAILTIAKQDQDLLGSGEADIDPIVRSLQKVAEAGAVEQTATAHADALHRWLTALPDSNGGWAAPLWFIEGSLRGCARFVSVLPTTRSRR
jgi:hypothetical protein